MFDAERLLSDLIAGQFTGRRYARKRYRHAGSGLGGAVGRAAFSPAGLTILGGLAVAAYEHLKEKRAGSGGAAASGGTTGSGAGTAPDAGPGGAIPETLPATPPPFTPPPFAPEAAPAMDAPPAPTAPPSEGRSADSDPQARARLLIEAMVHAAQADGGIDEEERRRILEHVERAGESAEARAHLERLMNGGTNLESIAARAQDPALAAEVYAASLLAIDPDTPAEQAYLARLAAALHLDPSVTRALEARLDARGEETNA